MLVGYREKRDICVLVGYREKRDMCVSWVQRERESVSCCWQCSLSPDSDAVPDCVESCTVALIPSISPCSWTHTDTTPELSPTV